MHRLEVEKLEIEAIEAELASNPNAMFADDVLRVFHMYAFMKAKNMIPVSAKLHPTKHMAHDFLWQWPLQLGTSLNDTQYAAIEEILRNPKVAQSCYCGQHISYGEGCGPKHRDGVTGVFCSQYCECLEDCGRTYG